MPKKKESTEEEVISIGSEVGKEVPCSICGKMGTTQEFTTLQGSEGQDVHFCPLCVSKTRAELEEQTTNINYIGAIIGALIGGLLGGVTWYLVAILSGYELGYISLLLGFLVGSGAHYGSGKKRGTSLQFLSAGVAIVSIYMTEYMMLTHAVNEYIRSNPSEFPDIDTASLFFFPLFSSPVFEHLISPMGILIYAIGIFIAYKQCKAVKI